MFSHLYTHKCSQRYSRTDTCMQQHKHTNVHTDICTHIHTKHKLTHNTREHTGTETHTDTNTPMRAHTSMHINIFTHLNTNTYTQKDTNTQTHIQMLTHISLYTDPYTPNTCTVGHTHPHAHTQKHTLADVLSFDFYRHAQRAFSGRCLRSLRKSLCLVHCPPHPSPPPAISTLSIQPSAMDTAGAHV